MSRHTAEYLHGNQRVGFGHRAWWFRETIEKAMKIPSHYIGAVPLAEVRRLFRSVVPTRGQAYVVYLDENGVKQTVLDEKVAPTVNIKTGDVFGYPTPESNWRSFETDLLNGTEAIIGQGIGDIGIQTAGLLDFGARAYVSLSIPNTMHDDKSGLDFRPNLIAATALDGSLATTYKRVITLPLCDNTVAAALMEPGQEIKIKHTTNSGVRVRDAQKALGLIESGAEAFIGSVHALVEMTVSPAQWSAFLDTVCPLNAESSKHAVTHATNRRDILENLAKNDPRCAAWFGTGFGVIQTMNTYRAHLAIRRGAGADGDKQALRAERNMSDVIMGRTEAKDHADLLTLQKVLATV
jgi:phage/plasmid-like protein (TIGR03299 family)